MIRKLLALALAIPLAATAATPAFAGDSSWLVCKGIATNGAGADAGKTYLVASLLEHRGAVDRDLGVTLIYGDHVTRGAIVGKANATFMGKPAALKLTNVDGKRNAFTGTGMLAADMKAFTVDGTIDFTFGGDAKATQVPFKATLACELLDDLAIGH